MGRNTFYSFGLDTAEARAWTQDTMFQAFILKARTARQERDAQFRLPAQFRANEILGRTRDLGIIDDGNFRLAGTQTGRMSSERPNLTTRAKKWCYQSESMWAVPAEAHDQIVDDEAMRMICEKAGESTSMTDPYMILKYNGPPDRRRAYG